MAARKRRPVLRWFGGKWCQAPHLIDLFPEHQTYVEPYGGAASVLLRKPRSYGEVYNDLDGDVVNLFRVLRNDFQATRLIRLLRLTPFAREEFRDCYLPHEEPVERARRLIALSFMGFGANAHLRSSTGFRGNVKRSGSTPAHDWMRYPDALLQTIERLQGVVIEQRDALDVIEAYDDAAALFYIDPPYMHSTRGRYGAHRRYTVEMDDRAHARLLARLQTVQGFVVLSAYAHPLYTNILAPAGWDQIEMAARADGARPRTEIVWLNPAAARAHA
jgi:DNA adenine methylase